MRKVQLNSIEGLEHLKDYYYIQENGELYGYNDRKLADPLNGRGYVKNNLQTDEGTKPFYRHRLVGLAFIDNSENKREINHIDEDKTNNDVSNLEWATRAENNKHGTRNERVGLKNTNGKCSKPVIGTCVKTGEQIEFPSIQEAGRQGFHQSAISKCCSGQRKTHKGYTWKFKE